MSLKSTWEFDNIVKDINNNDKFQDLKGELHHGISRYEHSMRVAKWTYLVTKNTKLNYEDATRGALLHDFYTDDDTKNYNTKETLKFHPEIALLNAKKYFDINNKQENIIASHMYPLGVAKPKYVESWIISAIDKGVAVYEMYRYKASLVMGIWIIFIFNLISIQR